MATSSRRRFGGAVGGALAVAWATLACGGAGAPGRDAADGADAADALDGVPASPDARRDSSLGSRCVVQRDCDDGIICDGVEECLDGFCISPRNAACRDPSGCANATCDEASGGCSIALSGGGATCSVATVCRPASGCVPVEGCTSDADPRCDDRRDCTRDSCDASTGACVHRPDDSRCPASVGACGVGVCYGLDVDAPSGCGAVPDASKCTTNEGCTREFACLTLPHACADDRECSDGSLCDGVERCVGGTCVHGDRTRCASRDACHHAVCSARSLGDPHCVDTQLVACP